jgi:hypothetical protein
VSSSASREVGSTSPRVDGALEKPRLRREAGDPIEQIFAAVDMAMEYYLADRLFYKTLWREVLGYALILAGAANENARERLIARTLKSQGRINGSNGRNFAAPVA